MKLKHILYILSAVLLSFISYSCNDSTTNTYGSIDASADAQIYKFSLKGMPLTKDDTIKYPAIASTFFHINQQARTIYNTDSLPYKINIKKLAATIQYSSSANPSKVDVIYRNLTDSSITLTGENDSIDFSRNDVMIKVTAQDGATIKEYTVNLAIHKINPDSIVWKKITLANPTLSNGGEKVVLKENTFYRYYLAGSTLALQTANKNAIDPMSWNTQSITGLSNSIKFDDIIILNDNFYAIDNEGKAYSSENGIVWDESTAAPHIHRIIGILPEATAENDSLLVVTKEGTEFYFEKTKDLKTFKRKTIINNSTIFDKDKFIGLLNSNYSSLTYYNRSNSNSNLLSLIGPRTANNNARNGWIFLSDRNGLSIAKSGTDISTLKNDASFSNFVYDDKFFALNKDSIYISNDWGKRWSKAPDAYSLPKGIVINDSQSTLVDDKDFIWIFGKMGTEYAVWRGRLNKLIK